MVNFLNFQSINKSTLSSHAPFSRLINMLDFKLGEVVAVDMGINSRSEHFSCGRLWLVLVRFYIVDSVKSTSFHLKPIASMRE